MKLHKTLRCVAVLTLFVSVNSVAEIAVVVNPGNDMTEISVKDAQRLYLGKTGKFPGGNKAEVIDQKVGEGSRDTFYKGVVGKSESQAKSYWSKQIFTGKGTPPPVVGSDAEVKARISANPQAIGYIDSSEVDDSVKRVLMVE